MSTKKKTRATPISRAHAECVKMRKKINNDLVPLMRDTVSVLNTLNRSIELVARELGRQVTEQKESEDT